MGCCIFFRSFRLGFCGGGEEFLGAGDLERTCFRDLGSGEGLRSRSLERSRPLRTSSLGLGLRDRRTGEDRLSFLGGGVRDLRRRVEGT